MIRTIFKYLFFWVAVRMVLECAYCFKPHVDRGRWRFRLHRRHLCEHCRNVFDPGVDDWTFGKAPPKPPEACS